MQDLAETEGATRALVLDVDGVVSPVHGSTAWGDDLIVGRVFGPVLVSPALCTRLDRLATRPDLTCLWLTDWRPEMRRVMDPFPGRGWEQLQRIDSSGELWWKARALSTWLDGHHTIERLVWCDDHLTKPALDGIATGTTRAEAAQAQLRGRGVDALLITPQASTGLTPHDLDRVEAHLFPDN